MAAKRFNKQQFFERLGAMDDDSVRKVLWTAYWRGPAVTRERIEAEIDPRVQEEQRAAARETPDSGTLLVEVDNFARLARGGSYMAGDRLVSPKERTRWRHTFRRLVKEAQGALVDEDIDDAASAVATLIDLACEMRDYEYFRSEDPVEAARFVVSDAAAALWSRTLQVHGFEGFAERAAGQLVQWESRFGWTRTGYGSVSERERPLAHVIGGMLPAVDSWGEFADHYLQALDGTTQNARFSGGRRGAIRNWRADALSEWNLMLLERLGDSDYEDRLDALVDHSALAGPEGTYLQARLAQTRGDRDRARTLIQDSLRSLPGHRDFLAFAKELGVSDPP